MSDIQEKPWSDNPNAPKIPYDLYFAEKAYFAGLLIASILYGIIVVLFFQCMAALFDPANRRMGGIKRGPISYTVATFSFATVLTAVGLHIESISIIDNREFPGIKGVLPPGPLGYQLFIRPTALTIILNLMFFFNNWLADGLLLYRCYVVYSTKLWVITFPCFMYIASVAMGIMTLIHRTPRPGTSIWRAVSFDFAIPYLSISISLNVLLTLMIAIRLILHSRNVGAAMGSLSGLGGLYKTIVTTLVESSALYAVSSLLVVVQASSGISNTFIPILCQTQVIASLLIIKRVANRSVLTGSVIITGRTSPLNLTTQEESAGGGDVPPGGYPRARWVNVERALASLGLGSRLQFKTHQDCKV